MKKNPLLGNGDYALMKVLSAKSNKRGLAIIDSNRFNAFKKVKDIPSPQYTENIDEEIDVIIFFENVNSINGLIDELNLLKEDMIINKQGTPSFYNELYPDCKQQLN